VRFSNQAKPVFDSETKKVAPQTRGIFDWNLQGSWNNVLTRPHLKLAVVCIIHPKRFSSFSLNNDLNKSWRCLPSRQNIYSAKSLCLILCWEWISIDKTVFYKVSHLTQQWFSATANFWRKFSIRLLDTHHLLSQPNDIFARKPLTKVQS